jgi:hypothetical protein
MAKIVATTCATFTRARYYLLSNTLSFEPCFCFENSHLQGPLTNIVASCLLLSVCLQVVYFAACVGVVLNPVTNTQRFFQGHSDDIQCMTLHPDMQTVWPVPPILAREMHAQTYPLLIVVYLCVTNMSKTVAFQSLFFAF